MLVLPSALYIARGGERFVYRHPSDRDLCVKVRIAGASRPQETAGEVCYWQHLERQGCDFSHIPRFQGWTATNLGEGTVWQLVQNDDGAVSPSLITVLLRGLATHEACRRRLAHFKDWMLTQGVITRDLHPKNLVCRFSRPGEFEVFLIDGWGNSEFLPVSSWSTTLNRKKIERRWTRFTASFESMLHEIRSRAGRGAVTFNGRRAA